MSDTSQTPHASASRPDSPRRNFFKRAAIATAVAGVAAGFGFKAFAQDGGPWRWPHDGFMGAPLDPAVMDQRLDRMLKHLYVEIDATDAQKQQLAPIVKGAAADLFPLRAQMRDARRQAIDRVRTRPPAERRTASAHTTASRPDLPGGPARRDLERRITLRLQPRRTALPVPRRSDSEG